MEFSMDTITNAIYDGIKHGIEVTLDNKCYGSAVILIYAGIDALVHLGIPKAQMEATDRDFISWVEKYIKIGSKNQITGEELYSARCAVLHAYGVESRRTRKGTARMIAYMDKGSPPIRYSPKIHANLVLLSIEALAKAFYEGIDRFLIDIFADSKMRPVIEARLPKLFITSSKSQLAEKALEKEKQF